MLGGLGGEEWAQTASTGGRSRNHSQQSYLVPKVVDSGRKTNVEQWRERR